MRGVSASAELCSVLLSGSREGLSLSCTACCTDVIIHIGSNVDVNASAGPRVLRQ